MIIKKFLGKTESEAVENAKKELGANIVIMNVKKAKRKGIFGLFGSQMIEVTVALEEQPEAFYGVVKKAPSAEQRKEQPVSGAVKTMEEKTHDERERNRNGK